MGVVNDRLLADKAMYELQQQRLPKRLEEATALRDAFMGPARTQSSSIISTLDNINTIKTSIQSAGGNTGLSPASYGTTVSSVTSVYGNAVTGVAITTGASLGVAGVGTATIAYGIIKKDIAQIYDYPKISGGNVGSDYPFTGGSYNTLTSSNVGSGVSTKLVQHGGSEIGKVFGYSASLGTLVSDYNAGWASVEDEGTLATTTQSMKGDYELQVWGLKRQVQENSEKIAEINTAVGIAQDPATGGPW